MVTEALECGERCLSGVPTNAEVKAMVHLDEEIGGIDQI